MQSGKEYLLEKLTKVIGEGDAGPLMEQLQALGINNFEIIENALRIPISFVTDLNHLRETLLNVSQVGRAFEVTSDTHSVFINTFKLKPSYIPRESLKLAKPKPYLSIFSENEILEDECTIREGECEHFQYGDHWVANRNILFKPNGEFVILNNISHPYNTIKVPDVIKHFGLNKNYKLIGNIEFAKEESSLMIKCVFYKNQAEFESLIKTLLEDRARKEIPVVIEKGYAENISPSDFYHAHPIVDLNNLKGSIYILYHTFEFSRPSHGFEKNTFPEARLYNNTLDIS